MTGRTATNEKNFDLQTVMGTFSAAYFNLGASFENMRKFKLAKQAYLRSKKICQTYMPESLGVITQLSDAIA